MGRAATGRGIRTKRETPSALGVAQTSDSIRCSLHGADAWGVTCAFVAITERSKSVLHYKEYEAGGNLITITKTKRTGVAP